MMSTTERGTGKAPAPHTAGAGTDAQTPAGATATERREAANLHDETVVAAPEMAASFGEYMRAWLKRVRSGESGMLPVLVGLLVIIAIFQIKDPIFLSAGNIVNLIAQGAFYMLLGVAEIFVLLLGDMDLSLGFVAAIGAAVTAIAVTRPFELPWWAALLAGLAVTTLIGILHGTLISRLHLPAFVVTLAGMLGWEGALILVIGRAPTGIGGTVSISDSVLVGLVNGNLSPLVGWIAMAAVVALYAAGTILADSRRRRSGLAAPPAGLTALKIGVVALVGVALVAVCNVNRGTLSVLEGVPWVVPIVLGVLVVSSFVLSKTKFGRYLYAMGGNAEAARRAGINLVGVRTGAFAVAGLITGIAGIVYASRLQSISTDIQGGTYVMYAMAAAVIGGASLFGGRGKPVHAVLGGVVIAAIANGLGLLGMNAAAQDIVTALVLLTAIIVDAVARGRGTRETAGA